MVASHVLIFGLLCIATITEEVSGSPSKRDISTEGVEDAILWGYKVDPDEPNYLRRADKIFQGLIKDETISIYHKHYVHGEYMYSNTEETAAEKYAASLGVRGSYGAFSGAASMSVSSNSNKDIKTKRVDQFIKAVTYEVNAIKEFAHRPEDFLTESFKESVKSMPVERLASICGEFFATKLHLGGEVRRSLTMQATEEDDDKNLSAELEAAYNGGLVKASVEASVEYGTRQSNKNAKTKVEWNAKGGNVNVWLGVSFNNNEGGKSMGEIQKKWLDTITDKNMFPFDYELRPMWDLVEAIDHEKGQLLKTYLEDKWTKNKNRFAPTKYLTSGSRTGCELQNKDFLGGDILLKITPTFEECLRLCIDTPRCTRVSWYKSHDHQEQLHKCHVKDNTSNGLSENKQKWLIAAERRCFEVKNFRAGCELEYKDFPGGDILMKITPTFEGCLQLCIDTPGCTRVSWYKTHEHQWQIYKCHVKNNTSHGPFDDNEKRLLSAERKCFESKK